MSKEIKINHDGIEITYAEKLNQWAFIINNRERHAPSLEEARKAIDRRTQESKKFERQKAFMQKAGGWQEVEVTSLAIAPQWTTGVYLWVKRPDGSKSKESLRYFRAHTPGNADLVKKIDALRKEADIVRQQIEKLEEKLTPFKI